MQFVLNATADSFKQVQKWIHYVPNVRMLYTGIQIASMFSGMADAFTAIGMEPGANI